jgi:hypothetical protein
VVPALGLGVGITIPGVDFQLAIGIEDDFEPGKGAVRILVEFARFTADLGDRGFGLVVAGGLIVGRVVNHFALTIDPHREGQLFLKRDSIGRGPGLINLIVELGLEFDELATLADFADGCTGFRFRGWDWD